MSNQYQEVTKDCFFVKKVVAGKEISFLANREIGKEVVVAFTVEGTYTHNGDTKQHPAIARFILTSFKECKEWAEKYGYRLTFTSYKADTHSALRDKAYNKVCNLKLGEQYHWISKKYIQQLGVKLVVGLCFVSTVVAIPSWFHHQEVEITRVESNS